MFIVGSRRNSFVDKVQLEGLVERRDSDYFSQSSCLTHITDLTSVMYIVGSSRNSIVDQV